MDNIIFIHRFLFWRNGEKMKNFFFMDLKIPEKGVYVSY